MTWTLWRKPKSTRDSTVKRASREPSIKEQCALLPSESSITMSPELEYVRDLYQRAEYMTEAYHKHARNAFRDMCEEHQREMQALEARCKEDKAQACAELNSQLQALHSEKNSLVEECNEAKGLREAARAELALVVQERDEKDSKLEEKTNELQDQVKENESLRMAKHDAIKQLNELQLQKNDTDALLAQKEEKLGELREDNEALEKKLAGLEQRCKVQGELVTAKDDAIKQVNDFQLQKNDADALLVKKEPELREIREGNEALAKKVLGLEQECKKQEVQVKFQQKVVDAATEQMKGFLADMFVETRITEQVDMEWGEFHENSIDKQAERVVELIKELRAHCESAQNGLKEAKKELKKLQELDEKVKSLKAQIDRDAGVKWNLQSRVNTYERENTELKDRVEELEQSAKSCTCNKQAPRPEDHDDHDEDHNAGDSDDRGAGGARGPDGSEGGEGGAEGADSTDGATGGVNGTDGAPGADASHPGPSQPSNQAQGQPQGQNHGGPRLEDNPYVKAIRANPDPAWIEAAKTNPVLNQVWWETGSRRYSQEQKDEMAKKWARSNPEAAVLKLQNFKKLSNHRQSVFKKQQDVGAEILTVRAQGTGAGVDGGKK